MELRKFVVELTKADLIEMHESIRAAIIQIGFDVPVKAATIIDAAMALPTESESLKKAIPKAWSILFSSLRADLNNGTRCSAWFTSMDIFDDGTVIVKATTPDGIRAKHTFEGIPHEESRS